MIRGIDYSWDRPPGASIKAAGFDFAARYLAYNTRSGTGGKVLTPVERDDLLKNDVAIVLVWETYARRANEGGAAGYADGLTASNAAGDLDAPESTAIYFAVDWDATEQQQLSIDEYLGAAADALGGDRVGVYAGHPVCSRCLQKGTAKWFWQTYAWSRGNWLDEAHIRQILNSQRLGTFSVDYDEAWRDNYGQWPPPRGPQPPSFPSSATYTIEPGDTFWAIEERYGWAHGALQSMNPDQDPTKLRIGQQINVPVNTGGASGGPSATDTYTIRSGDTFWGLEQAHGWPHGTLQNLNPDIDPTQLQVGQEITVALGIASAGPRAAKAYTVVPGDTLSAIAAKVRLPDWHTLYDLNRDIVGSDPDRISPGQVLRLPY